MKHTGRPICGLVPRLDVADDGFKGNPRLSTLFLRVNLVPPFAKILTRVNLLPLTRPSRAGPSGDRLPLGLGPELDMVQDMGNPDCGWILPRGGRSGL